jgi:dephospho-CoA kinase
MDVFKIALCGFARSGKDSVAAYLRENYGFVRFAFADEMKRCAYDIFGEPEDGKKPRDLLQWFGETMRQREEKVWIRKMFESIERYGREWKLPFNVVVTDLRLPVEYEVLRKQDFTIIRIESPIQHRLERMQLLGDQYSLEDLGHSTESYIESFNVDYTIYNDSGFNSIWEQVDVIYRDILAKRRAN